MLTAEFVAQDCDALRIRWRQAEDGPQMFDTAVAFTLEEEGGGGEGGRGAAWGHSIIDAWRGFRRNDSCSRRVRTLSSLSSPLDGEPPVSGSIDATDARCTIMHVTAWSVERRLRKDSSSRITACRRRWTAADSITLAIS